MSIKHLPGFTPKELKKLNPDIPIYNRREAWFSPLAIPMGIGVALFLIAYGLFFIFKWIFLSWLVTFIDWKWFCQIDFHKYRKAADSSSWGSSKTRYECKVCKKEKFISKD